MSIFPIRAPNEINTATAHFSAAIKLLNEIWIPIVHGDTPEKTLIQNALSKMYN